MALDRAFSPIVRHPGSHKLSGINRGAGKQKADDDYGSVNGFKWGF